MQPVPVPPRGSRNLAPLRAVAPLVIAVAILTAGNGLLTTKTSLELALADAGVGTIRVIVTGYPVGFLIGCATAHRLIARLGHGRTFQLMALLTAAATLLFLVSTDRWEWAALRAANGFALASAFTVAESWVNLDSGPRNRGSLIGFYMIMSTLGLATGQQMINLGDPAGQGLFILSAATCILSALPFAIDGRFRPARRMPAAAGTAVEADEGVSLARLLRITPVVAVAALQTGMTNMNFGVLAPIYAADTGHSAALAAGLVSTWSVGGVLAQLPVGWLSDRVDRRLILAGAGLVAALACLATATLGHLSTPLLFALFFVYGASTLSIYPVAIAYAGSKVESRFIVAISGRLLSVYAVGAVIAPALSNELMARLQPAALFLLLGTVALAVGLGALLEFALGGRKAA